MCISVHHDRYGSCFRSMTLFSSIHNRRLMFQIKIDLFRGGVGMFFFPWPCSYTYTNFRLRIWHQYIDTRTLYACTKIYTIQNSKTKPGDNPENEQNGTDCNDVSIKRAGATHTHTHAHTSMYRH